MILGPSWGLKVYKLSNTSERALFFDLIPQGPKIKKLAKFPSNVWKTHEMQQPGQKGGSKSYLEPNKKGLTNFAIEIIESPKMYRI